MRNDYTVIKAALDENNNNDEINLIIVNLETGVTIKEGCNYYPSNTLEQVFQSKKKELGLVSTIKITYVNKDTMEETSDGTMKLNEFGLTEGSTLAIKDNARNA